MRKNEILIDSRFFVPNNIVDVRFSEDIDVNDSYSGYGDSSSVDITPTSPISTTTLPTPNVNFDIISQTIKTAPDGTQTVDVVIELPSVPGAEYEVRYYRIA